MSYSDRVRSRFLEHSYDSLMFFFDASRTVLEGAAQVYSEDQRITGLLSAPDRAIFGNLTSSLKRRFELDGIAVLDDQGSIKLSDNTFLEDAHNLGLPKLVSSMGKTSGFWYSGDDKLWFFSSLPIQAAKSQDGRIGTLVLSFLLDDRFEKNISLKLGVKAEFFHYSSFSGKSPADVSRFPDTLLLTSWKELLYTQKAFLVKKDLKEGAEGYLFLDILVRDILGDPIGILRITDQDSYTLFPHRDILFLLWSVILFLAFSFIFMVKVLTRHITMPLVKLKTAIKEITDSGNLSGRLAAASEDEVGGLSLEFNNMLDTLEGMNKKINNTNEELTILYGDLLEQKRFTSEVLNLAPSIVLVLLPDGRIKYVNDAVEAVTGFKVEESLGRFWFDQFVPFSSRSQVKAVFDEILGGDIGPHRQKESCILTKDGRERLVLWNNSVLKSSEGNISAVLSVGQDITELKEMQAELLKKISDLERFYKVSMDREKAILHLKEQINELKAKCNILEDREKKAP